MVSAAWDTTFLRKLWIGAPLMLRRPEVQAQDG